MTLVRLPIDGFVIFWLQNGDACHSNCTLRRTMLTKGTVVGWGGLGYETPKSVRSIDELAGYCGCFGRSLFQYARTVGRFHLINWRGNNICHDKNYSIPQAI